MRLKIQRFLPFSILSLMALAQPASAQTPAIAQRMNTLLLGLFGLTGSNFATQAGDAAWIFVLCGFLIIFGIVFAVSNYLPFFKDQSNRGARIAFSTGLGIASLVTPGYLDFLWDIGFITFIIALIAILSLCYFIFRGIISGHRAAGANDAETQARADQANAQANQAREGAQTLTREQHEAREAINRAQRVADEHTTLEVGNQTRAEAAAVGTHNLAITQQRTQQVNANRTREAAEEMQVRRGQAVTEFNRLMGIGVDLTRDATGSLRTLQDRLQTIQTSLRAVEGGGLPEDQRVNLLRDIGAAAGVARDMTKVVLAENAALQQIHDIEDHLRHLLGDRNTLLDYLRALAQGRGRAVTLSTTPPNTACPAGHPSSANVARHDNNVTQNERILPAMAAEIERTITQKQELMQRFTQQVTQMSRNMEEFTRRLGNLGQQISNNQVPGALTNLTQLMQDLNEIEQLELRFRDIGTQAFQEWDRAREAIVERLRTQLLPGNLVAGFINIL